MAVDEDKHINILIHTRRTKMLKNFEKLIMKVCFFYKSSLGVLENM